MTVAASLIGQSEVVQIDLVRVLLEVAVDLEVDGHAVPKPVSVGMRIAQIGKRHRSITDATGWRITSDPDFDSG